MNDGLPVKVTMPPPPDLGHHSPAPMDEGGSQPSPIHIGRIFVFLRKLWWVPFLTLVLSLGAAVAFVLWSPPTFVSKARMWETVKLRLPEATAFSEDLQNYVGTQMELLRSGRLHQLAIARLQVSSTNAIPHGSDGQPLEVKINVSQAPKSSIYTVEAASSNPAYTQVYLNALVEEYLQYKKTVRKTVTGDTLASISDQVQRFERDLKTEQEAYTSFQRTNNLAVLEEEGRTAGGYLARLKTQMADLNLESQLLKATALELDSAKPGATNAGADLGEALRRLSAGSSAAAGPGDRLNGSQELAVLKFQRERLSRFMKPKHPKIVRLDAEIERSEKLIEVFRKQGREQLAAAQQALQMKMDNVQASIKEWEAKVVEASARFAEAERLRLNISRTQGMNDRLVLLLQNVDISRNLDQETLSILEPASEALRTYKEELTALALAVVGGLGLGLGLVVLVALRDDRFTTIIEVNDKFGDSIVGQVPEVLAPRKKGPLPLLEENDQRHMFAESYRSLRSALVFLPVEGERPKTLLITSALPNEGKSTVAANLARAMALGGSRVLLVDADMRRGLLHELLGMQRAPGLAELLQHPENQDQYIQTNSLPNLSFIARGGSMTHAGDLFLRPVLGELLARWRQEFDYVLIDSCPVFAADDATTLAPKVDGTLFVVRNRFSGAREVRAALELLCQRQARVLGLIYNRADSSARSYYYYKHPDYYGAAQPA